MDTYNFDEAYNKAMKAINSLREEAEALEETIDKIIEACNKIDNAS